MTVEAQVGRRARRRLLPQGTPLPDDVWMVRHRVFLIAAWTACAVALGWATAVRGLLHGVVDSLPIAAATLLAALASARTRPRTRARARTCADAGTGGEAATSTGARRWRREAASCAVMLALMIAASVAVHLSGGLIEAHFLFFVAVGAAAAYQTWAPFLTAVGFVVVHHGLLASLPGYAIFNHPAAQDRPWLWALVHGVLLAMAAAVGIASWRADEVVRARLARLGSRSRLIVSTVADGIVALDGGGRVVEANPAAVRLLGQGPLTGRRLCDLVEGLELAHLPQLPAAQRSAPVHSAPVHPASIQRGSIRRGGSCTPVAFTVAPVQDDERVRAVLTLRDLSSAARADSAERALLDMAEREQVQREAVAALMSALRPPALSVQGLHLAVAYEPAASAPAGGDLYDWLVLPSGEVLLIVVDAMGRGVSATRQALAVTSTVRTLAVTGCPLGELVARAGAVVEVTHPQLMATLLIAVLDPLTGRVRLAGGGHPPAMLITPSGARELTAQGQGVGYPEPGSLAVTEVLLAPGDSLVLYTDGLVEGTHDIDEGLRELAATAAGMVDVPVQEFVQRLLTDVSTCARDDDDCLAVVVRRSLPPGPAEREHALP